MSIIQQPPQVPQNREQGVNQVINALIARNNRHSMTGSTVIFLNALHALFEKSPDSILIQDFEKIVRDGALTFATMGFIPVYSYEVNIQNMTLTIHVDDVAVSDR